jgi:hypothetical protein
MAAAFLPSAINMVYETTVFTFRSDFIHFPTLFNKDVKLKHLLYFLHSRSVLCHFQIVVFINGITDIHLGSNIILNC